MRRRGWWMRVARERKGLKLTAAAELLGYAKGSIGTLSRWESGDRPVPSAMLVRAADIYGVPETVFTRPEPTDIDRLDEIVRLANDHERQDWEEGQGRDQPGAA